MSETEYEREQRWLKSLKVGDEVAVYYSGSFYGRHEFTRIASETAKYFSVSGYKYRKEDGRRAGDPYRSRLIEPTEQLKAEKAEEKRRGFLTKELNAVRWSEVSTATLEGVYVLVTPPEEPK